MKLDREDLLKMYRWLVLIRLVEETCARLLLKEEVIGTYHLGIGQEAIPVGSCFHLRKDDIVIPYIRGRGTFLVKGVPLRKIMAGLFGKKTSLSGGRWAHHHVGDKRVGILVSSGIIGTDFSIATGIALAAKLQNTGQVVINFFGDGASNSGNFHEALNFAGVRKLPNIFICENNLYALSTPFSRVSAISNIASRARGYGFPGVIVDGNDVLKVHETVQKAVNGAREGQGPTLIECKTYRWCGHNQNDPDLHRSEEERRVWRQKCPIKRFEKYLYRKGILTQALSKKIYQEAEQEIEKAIKWAKAGPCPRSKDALEDVELIYSNKGDKRQL